MREKGQTEVAKTLETPVFSRGIEILTEKIKFEKKVRLWGRVATGILIGIPYLGFLVALEVIKLLYIKINNVTDISWYSITLIAGGVIVTAIIAALFKKGKAMCFKKVRKFLQRN